MVHKARLFGPPKTELLFVLLQQRHDSNRGSTQSEEPKLDQVPASDQKEPKPVTEISPEMKRSKEKLTTPIILELKDGSNQIGRNEIHALQTKYPNQVFEQVVEYISKDVTDSSPSLAHTSQRKKNKLSRNQIAVTIQKGFLYHHATVQLLGANPSVIQRITETGHIERFYMEKGKVYTICPGDVVYLLKGLYPLRLEEHPIKQAEPVVAQAEQKQEQSIPETPVEVKQTQGIKVEELEIKWTESLEELPIEKDELDPEESELEGTDDKEEEDLSALLATDETALETEEDVVKLYKMLRKQAKKEKKQMELLKHQLQEFSQEIETMKAKRNGIEALALDPGRPRTRSIDTTGHSSASHSPEHELEKSRPHLRGSGELILPSKISNKVLSVSSPASPISSKKKRIPAGTMEITPGSPKPIARQRSFTALHPLGTMTLMQPSASPQKAKSKPAFLGLGSFSVPICPGIRLEIKKVVQFEMTKGVKEQLAEFKRLQNAKKPESSPKTL